MNNLDVCVLLSVPEYILIWHVEIMLCEYGYNLLDLCWIAAMLYDFGLVDRLWYAAC